MAESSELQKVLGANLYRMRQERGYSQEEFAQYILDVHRTYVGALERGERNPSLLSVEKIAGKLGVEPLWLLHEHPDDEPLPASFTAGK
ncbi:helix-turn-helix domain-containing protein [Brevibacterium litoralis]|uniref:helix-turn-helix domain-containing protein n=1 Tax=Brevibacterium litoralis TaxID=3138935 RepID=UPI0032EEA5B4